MPGHRIIRRPSRVRVDLGVRHVSSQRTISDVRFAAHYELNSDIAPWSLPFSDQRTTEAPELVMATGFPALIMRVAC
jgi:hypothetical protein